MHGVGLMSEISQGSLRADPPSLFEYNSKSPQGADALQYAAGRSRSPRALLFSRLGDALPISLSAGKRSSLPINTIHRTTQPASGRFQ